MASSRHRILGIAILFSTLGTGIGQIYNRQYVKALFFIVIGVVFNKNGGVNHSLIYSFSGNSTKALAVLNLPWALDYMTWFYVAMWDAYSTAYEQVYATREPPLNAIPFAAAVMMGDIVLVFAVHQSLDPIIYGIVGSVSGIFIGATIKLIIQNIGQHRIY